VLMNSLIDKCFEEYKQVISANRDKFEEGNLEHFHDLAKTKAKLMFKDERKMGNDMHDKKYSQKLEETIEKNFEEWKKETEDYLKQVKQEKDKTEAAIIEKEKAEKEKLEAERIAEEKQVQLKKAEAALDNLQEELEAKLKAIQDQTQSEIAEVRKAAVEREAKLKKDLEETQRNLDTVRSERARPSSGFDVGSLLGGIFSMIGGIMNGGGNRR
jgi:flagellar biosynthesis GTPase FlhF